MQALRQDAPAHAASQSRHPHSRTRRLGFGTWTPVVSETERPDSTNGTRTSAPSASIATFVRRIRRGSRDDASFRLRSDRCHHPTRLTDDRHGMTNPVGSEGFPVFRPRRSYHCGVRIEVAKECHSRSP